MGVQCVHRVPGVLGAQGVLGILGVQEVLGILGALGVALRTGGTRYWGYGGYRGYRRTQGVRDRSREACVSESEETHSTVPPPPRAVIGVAIRTVGSRGGQPFCCGDARRAVRGQEPAARFRIRSVPTPLGTYPRRYTPPPPPPLGTYPHCVSAGSLGG